MSTLTQIRTALQGNQEVTIVGMLEKNVLPGRNGSFSHVVDIYLAPKTNGHTIEDLQAMLVSLSPGLLATERSDFIGPGFVRDFGILYFDENIGQESERREITLTDESLFSCNGFVQGKQVLECTAPLFRRTRVRLYRDRLAATVALEERKSTEENTSPVD